MKLRYDKLFSSFAFNFNLRPYIVASAAGKAQAARAAKSSSAEHAAAGTTTATFEEIVEEEEVDEVTGEVRIVQRVVVLVGRCRVTPYPA